MKIPDIVPVTGIDVFRPGPEPDRIGVQDLVGPHGQHGDGIAGDHDPLGIPPRVERNFPEPGFFRSLVADLGFSKRHALHSTTSGTCLQWFQIGPTLRIPRPFSRIVAIIEDHPGQFPGFGFRANRLRFEGQTAQIAPGKQTRGPQQNQAEYLLELYN